MSSGTGEQPLDEREARARAAAATLARAEAVAQRYKAAKAQNDAEQGWLRLRGILADSWDGTPAEDMIRKIRDAW